MRDLKKANQLISEIARENKYISPVSLKDFDLFQRFFKREPHTYGNSWTYVVQGKYGIGPYGFGTNFISQKRLKCTGLLIIDINNFFLKEPSKQCCVSLSIQLP